MITKTLRNGATVLAKETEYGVMPYTFANLTQANRAAERIASTGAYVRAFGRPFFVVIPTHQDSGVTTMTRREAVRQTHQEDTLRALGFTSQEADSLRRISMQLHRWHELECGADNGGVERDETTGKCFWYNANTGKRYPCADRETGARKRLAAIMANHPTMNAYVQGDPRGAALYIIRPEDVPAGADVNSYYTRGIVVY